MASENGQEKRETLADIVAEMRTRSREVKEAFGGRPDGVENMLDIWADRIEAVAKRVVVSKTETTTFGNAAAMHEALESFMVGSCVYPCVCSGYDPIDELCMRCTASPKADGDCPYENARKALSAPARNCDLPLVVEGPADTNANRAWRVFKYRNPGAYFDVPGLLRCIDWPLAPAAEQKGETK